MDDEKFQRAIDIILENKAQFYANLQEIQEMQKESEKRLNILERVSLNLYNVTLEHTKQMTELRETQKEADEHLRETDERLNAVIFMAEKFFGSQNGKS